MNRKLEGTLHATAPMMMALALAGCASQQPRPAEAQQQFAAGMEEAFGMLKRSGIEVLRIVGPFERPVVQWRQGMTLAEVILAAGYLDPRDPDQIFIQRGPTALAVDTGALLNGEDIPVEPGDVIHVLP